MNLGIDIQSAETISRAFTAFPSMVVREMETAMGSALGYLQHEVADLGPKNAGLLAQNWSPTVQSSDAMVVGVLRNSLSYAIPVELGTKPHFPPVDAIQNWVEVKLHLYGAEAEEAARSIAWKIAHYGTKGHFMAHRALADGKETIADEFRAAAARIVTNMAAAQ